MSLLEELANQEWLKALQEAVDKREKQRRLLEWILKNAPSS